MGNSEQTQAKEQGSEKENAQAPQHDPKASQEPHSLHGLSLVDLEHARKTPCCTKCFDALFVILSIVTILKSIADIVVTIAAAISTKLFSSDQSGRLVGMVLLAFLAAVTISILIYAMVAVFRKQARPLHAAALVLFITAIVQAVVVGVSVRATDRDQQNLIKSLKESFELAREENPRHVALWATTQHELKCCGLYGPADYRSYKLPGYFAPNIPISCCPAYDPTRSDLVQEAAREACKATKAYYSMGCLKPVVDTLETASEVVLGLTVAIIVIEVILAIIAAILYKKVKKYKTEIKSVGVQPITA